VETKVIFKAIHCASGSGEEKQSAYRHKGHEAGQQIINGVHFWGATGQPMERNKVEEISRKLFAFNNKGGLAAAL
jgi:hypothetical protein